MRQGDDVGDPIGHGVAAGLPRIRPQRDENLARNKIGHESGRRHSHQLPLNQFIHAIVGGVREIGNLRFDLCRYVPCPSTFPTV